MTLDLRDDIFVFVYIQRVNMAAEQNSTNNRK